MNSILDRLFKKCIIIMYISNNYVTTDAKDGDYN
jgi:hypothetical protein